MGDAKRVPEDDVFVVDLLGRVRLDPLGETHRRLAGGLGYVATGRVDLVVGVWRGLVLVWDHGGRGESRRTYTL